MAYSATTPDDKPESIVDKAKRCWKLAVEAEANQRTREREDIEFQIAENQWDADAKKRRKGRPMLSVSLLRQPMQLVHNQAASAQLGVDIHPVNETATDELAEVKQGIYRRIERDSNAEQARLWALDRAKQCGRGWYRVNTQWDEDGDDPWDQEIVIDRILHQESVYVDPAAEKPDFSDAEWAFVSTWMPVDRFKREFPKAKVSETSDLGFEEMAQAEPEWVRTQSGKRAIRVVEYFYKVHDYETLTAEVVIDGKTTKRERKRDNITVKWCKIAGCEDEPLEETDWNGRYIPLIPVIGVELQPIDGERRFEGMVRPARDAQKAFNYAISSEVEDVGRTSKAPYIGAAGQFENFEEQWETANTENWAFLQYNVVTDKPQGQPLPPPSPMQIDGSKMQLSMQLAAEAKSLVQAATAIYDPSLGQVSAREKSGRHVLALQQQADASTSHFVQNLAKISMRYEAMVVLDLMPKIYDRPGRVTRVLGGEDETRVVMLNQPFVMDQGRPMPAQPGQPGVKTYDLTQGKYSLSITVGRSHQTRMEEGAEEIGKILEAAPDLMPIIGPTYFRFRDFPGAKEIADLLKEMREKQYPGLGQDKDNPMDPKQLQAQLQAMQQQMQMQQQQMQMMQQALETDQAKQQAQIMVAQMREETARYKTEADNATKMAVAQKSSEDKAIVEELKLMLQQLKGKHETGDHREQMAHERGMQAEDHEHERELKSFDAAHQTAMAAAGGETYEMARENGQESNQESSNEESQEQGSDRTMARPEEGEK